MNPEKFRFRYCDCYKGHVCMVCDIFLSVSFNFFCVWLWKWYRATATVLYKYSGTCRSMSAAPVLNFFVTLFLSFRKELTRIYV